MNWLTTYNSQKDDDPFVRGEFEVIKELMEKLPGAVEAKKKVDRIIDLCGPAPKVFFQKVFKVKPFERLRKTIYDRRSQLVNEA